MSNYRINRFSPYCAGPVSKIEGFLEMFEDESESKWLIHHRLETHTFDGKEWVKREKSISMKKLIEMDLYYHRPPEELIFMKVSDHQSLHTSFQTPWNKGKKGVQVVSEETKKKISKYQKEHTNAGRWKKGQPSWNKGTNISGMSGKHHSAESKRKSSESNKLAWLKRDHTPEIWINDGETNKRIKITQAIPEGWSRGRKKKCK